MQKSEQINDLAAALSKAQGQMGGALKDSANPFFKSKYADLASVTEAIRGPLAENGLSYVQLPRECEGERVVVETVLLHASGQWISNEVEVPVTKADAQGYGSALTYARRYGLSAITGVAPEDDDGNAAAKAAPKNQVKPEDMMPTAQPFPADQWAGRAPDVGQPVYTTTFEWGKSHYRTAGVTKEQFIKIVDLWRLVKLKTSDQTVRDMLKGEFGVVSKNDLTEEHAEQFIIRLTEIANS